MADIFSFVLVMVSLVLAIGVTHLIHGVATLVRRRSSIRLELLPLVWAANLFVVAALYWWSLWDFRSVDWRFHHFFYVLLAPTLLHVAASLLMPAAPVEAGAMAQSEFDRVRLPFMVVMAVFSILVTWDGLFVGAEPVWTAYRWVQLCVVGLYVAGALFRSAGAQRTVAGIVFVTYVVAGFFFRFIPGAFGS